MWPSCTFFTEHRPFQIQIVVRSHYACTKFNIKISKFNKKKKNFNKYTFKNDSFFTRNEIFFFYFLTEIYEISQFHILSWDSRIEKLEKSTFKIIIILFGLLINAKHDELISKIEEKFKNIKSETSSSGSNRKKMDEMWYLAVKR